MSSFDESQHPRGHHSNPGRFSEKTHSEPEAALTATLPPYDGTGFTEAEFDTITDEYLVAALWTSEDDGEVSTGLDGSQSIYDFHPDARTAIQNDLGRFLRANREQLTAARGTGYGLASGDASGFLGQVGHDFWLTRNGHGAGFWDRSELTADGIGQDLSDSAREFGESAIYLGDDGKVHLEY